MADTPPVFDAARLIADVRRGDAEALAQAYKVTFQNPLGRLVLAHFMAGCGVGGILGDHRLEYAAGRHDAAVMLMNAAGFDQISAVVAVMTDELEGSEDERSYNHGHRNGDPDNVFDDEF